MDWSFAQMLTALIFCGAVFKLESLYQKKKSKWFRALLYMVTAFLIYGTGFTNVPGWSSSRELPDQFIFIKGIVQVPTENNEGKIFLWIRRSEDPNQPFSIELPYDSEIAKQVLEIDELAQRDGELAIELGSAVVKRKKTNQPVKKQKETKTI